MKARRIYSVDCSWCFNLGPDVYFQRKSDAWSALIQHRKAKCGGTLKITTWIPWQPK